MRVAEEIESDVLSKPSGVTVLLIKRALAEATEAFVALANVDPNDAPAIRALQNDIQRLHDMVRWLREIVDTAAEYQQQITEEDRETIAEILDPEPGED